MSHTLTTRIIFICGVVLIAIGFAGVFKNPVFGLFAVNKIHNFIHLAVGLLAIAFVVHGVSSAKNFSKIFGAVFGALAIMGFLIPDKMLFGIIESSLANDSLHAFLGIIFLIVGFTPHLSQQSNNRYELL
ncbi:hypothetical protein A3D60_00065 [Candidatus Uhrbacteria bacterium RIFCSPHIGHO2_02_FULL_47_29]|uniref:DUF4383 domain-containing protein n=1 Tax=Candidatus Uhrbacteria bacterium RIFCSPLOWO2_01_FULL_47_25 TaxID=1802402 RepID=A0A1F7USL7_9BACT|nr:MAG: TonB-dependent siderophore receptor [Parcubacteria group bacterium GW2011_GWA2_46_9]OGL60860.1 MAG: hypothetical protein A2752_00425 [Candidatus Uhrbacteria bacterium RIFCSPHIGHO2_01_FULL_46_23]OGL69921.1 MAG: hypothetical protein A3D60_00065 [Candidatus Uhrbacteria bacterium RIFCSPHIGHO2_02_FULL_47_29]OGL81246.1 MAG: hypothetical protein A2936_03035 [Candidatus Uhrbacteria bacterium RIFCSPLOWO2_01_FULL_47_25]OGL86023.1 MAG: hypothetical protein A3I37_01375 [Candidatus Uhrbacteria bacte